MSLKEQGSPIWAALLDANFIELMPMLEHAIPALMETVNSCLGRKLLSQIYSA
jgi:hypothetical protein